MSDFKCAKCQGWITTWDQQHGRVSAGGTMHPACDVDDRTLLLQLIASLTLCDHMGDVSNDVDHVLRRLGIAVEEDDDRGSGIARALHALGITTLVGTSIGGETTTMSSALARLLAAAEALRGGERAGLTSVPFMREALLAVARDPGLAEDVREIREACESLARQIRGAGMRDEREAEAAWTALARIRAALGEPGA